MSESPRASRGGAVYLFVMGLFLMFLGAGFCWLLWAGFKKANETRTWQQTPAKILDSRLEEYQLLGDSARYRWVVSYEYKYEGEVYTSSLHKPRGAKWTQKKKEADELTAKFTKGDEVECFVNPNLPEVAILEHDTRASGYSIWFPALFSIGGIGIMVGAVRSFFSKELVQQNE